MEKRKTRKINIIVTISLLVIYIVTGVIQYFVFDNFIPFAFFETVGTLILLGALFSWWTDSLYYCLVVFFACFAQFGGVMFNLYSILPSYDIILHLFSGILLCFVAHYIFVLLLLKKKQFNVPLSIGMWSSFFTAVAAAGIWEIFEFFIDRLFGLDCQLNSLTDTMTDIVAGTVGAIIGVTALYFIVRKTKGKAYKN